MTGATDRTATFIGSFCSVPEAQLADYLAVPERRRPPGYRSRYAALAVAVLADAVEIVRRGPEGTLKAYCPCRTNDARGCRCYQNAVDWLADAEAERPFSLRWCCLWLSIALGDDVEPQNVVEMVQRGELGAAILRRVAGNRTEIGAHRKWPRRGRGRPRKVAA